MVDLNTWYDPISERWIAPRRARTERPASAAPANHLLEHQRTAENQRIWRALLDCCARN
jgi:hypothetical protein